MNELFNLPVREQIASVACHRGADLAVIDKLEDTMKQQINGIVPVGGEGNAGPK